MNFLVDYKEVAVSPYHSLTPIEMIDQYEPFSYIKNNKNSGCQCIHYLNTTKMMGMTVYCQI